MQETMSRRERLRREKQAKENAAKKSNMKTYVHQTPFREAERNFKSRNPPPDFSEVYDIISKPNDERLEQVELSYDLRTLTPLFGSTEEDNENKDQQSTSWKERSRKAYIIKDMPGLVIIPNPFTPAAERSLIQKCLSDYPQAPNTSNLHTHYNVPSTGLWSLYEKEQNGTIPMDDPTFYIQKKNKKEGDNDDDESSDDDKRYSDDEDDEEEEEIKPSTPPPQQQESSSPSCTTTNTTNTTTCPLKQQQQQNRTLIIPLKACDDDFNPLLNQPKPEPPAASTVPLLPTSELMKRLRWITLGYHYHWPTKTYHLDRRFPVPDAVKGIVTSVVYAIENIGSSGNGESDWKNIYQGKSYHPEAGVVNYYQYRDTLMGHVDRSELNMDAPLISISLGNACIYLLGGEDRNKKPAALYLRSGDIIAMTKLCRRSFHGVPRIIEDTLPEYLKAEGDYPDAPNWKLYGQYMTTSRININIRQVKPVD